jgi:hypothetical protein
VLVSTSILSFILMQVEDVVAMEVMVVMVEQEVQVEVV